ncbi:glycosyltransferase [Curtobacterium sp. MCBD17_019]|uniref:glycosyltransferase family 2 protein n=1 Tax=Curtobacterium sp. MCBD17_019 TaxID=2175669 RepID=UPI000DA9E5DB|nr:glycosyltransferase [Curtobacterium sp. MCBD17_019]PZE76276.1 glycosyltransferase family 2 protein [Curtobacterium sp. MCBD17_019]
MVVPVLDDASVLRRCLASVAVQTVPVDEVIVVDNGSTDDSVAVALAAGATVLHEPVRGIAAAASCGYDAASGDVIARVDADSVLPPDWVDRALRAFEDPRVVAVTGPGRFRDLGPIPRAFWQLAYMRAYFVLMWLALARPPVFGSNTAFTRAAWTRVSARVDRRDPALHDDVDLSLHLDPAWRVVVDPGLRAEISSDPLRDRRGLVVRTRKALHTLGSHGRAGLPWYRWFRRGFTMLRAPAVPSRAVGWPGSPVAAGQTPSAPGLPEHEPRLRGTGTAPGHDRGGDAAPTAASQ